MPVVGPPQKPSIQQLADYGTPGPDTQSPPTSSRMGCSPGSMVPSHTVTRRASAGPVTLIASSSPPLSSIRTEANTLQSGGSSRHGVLPRHSCAGASRARVTVISGRIAREAAAPTSTQVCSSTPLQSSVNPGSLMTTVGPGSISGDGAIEQAAATRNADAASEASHGEPTLAGPGNRGEARLRSFFTLRQSYSYLQVC